jgi:hypothetical protein
LKKLTAQPPSTGSGSVVSHRAFCYIELAMRQFARSASAPRWTAVLMAVIVGSLCFSAGERLRLTPFPVSQVTETKDLSSTNETGNASLAKYGPLDVPSLVQKRSKRQTTDFAFKTSASASHSVTFARHYAAERSCHSISSRFVSRPPGRDPPFIS